MTARLVKRQIDPKPHPLNDECQNVREVKL